MEFASYLAGERWSDHPACTHPALAFLARMVNDCTTSAARSRLAEFIPSVIGLTGDDPRVEVSLALRTATTALPVASEERQCALATGMLCCRQLFSTLDPTPGIDIDVRIRQAFDQAPLAERWARDFAGSHPAPTTARSIARMAESMIGIAVLGIAQACISDPDERLRTMLAAAIDDCTLLLHPSAAAPDSSWAPMPTLVPAQPQAGQLLAAS
jgi:hypothetical protein